MKNKEKDIKNCECSEHKHHTHNYGGGNGNAIYSLGVIGAMFYFLQNTSGIEAILWGIGKAIFWPALLMFKLLAYLNL